MNETVLAAISSPDTICFKTTTTSQWHYDAEFVLPEKTSHLRKQTEMFLAMHGLSRPVQTAGRVRLTSGIRTNDMLKMQKADDQRKN